MDGVLHLQVLEGEGVDALPEGFDGDDVFEHGRQAVFVGDIGGVGGDVLLMVDGVGVSKRWWTDLSEHVHLHG